MYKKQNDVVYYFGLRMMNDSLLTENAKLRQQLAQYSIYDTLKDTMVRRPIPTDSANIVQYANYIYRTARVINNSVSSENNYITINRGEADGVKKNQSIISSTGVVGRVVHVTDNYASALSVLSVKQQVSAKLKDGTVGYVSWNGERPDVMVMRDVPQQIKVKRGDSVFTTSYSFFPPNILIGVVYKTANIKKNNLQLLYLRTATNFRNLQYVYVVENTMLEERMKLEDSVKRIK
jgi:rod shape-determining protein MreC